MGRIALKRRVVKRVIFLMLSITLICLCFTGCGSENSPLDTANEFMAHIARGDYSEAYPMLSEASQQQMSLGEFGNGSGGNDYHVTEKERREQEEALNKMKYELAKESEDEALVYVTHADYPSSYHTIALVKEDNVWKIDFFNSSLLVSAKEGADEQTCKANMRLIKSSANIYAADNGGIYPTSWDSLVPEYVDDETTPFCPLDGSPYTIEWSDQAPPEIECVNHGTL
ncbi:MAG: DUF4878 domain-containing protein [Actinomycetota bacterium]